MEVRSRVRRIEGVQVEVVKLLRKDREARRQTIVIVDDVVETRKRIEALAFDIALVFVESFKTGHVRADETIFNTLEEKQFVFLDGTADCDPRCSSADTVDFPLAPAWSWQRSRNQVTPI